MIQPNRQTVNQLQPSLIRKLGNLAPTIENLIPLWYGEPNLPTPDFIRQAAIESWQAGQTFYQANLGIPALRETLATYMNDLYGTQFGAENIVITSSGLSAVMVASQCATSHGDTIVTHGPTWPNLPAIQQVLGANIVRVPLRRTADKWTLDLDELFAACTPETKLLLINSPSNPTGWLLGDAEQQAILDFCRERDLWLIADEVYNRLAYGRLFAPTFADKINEDDKVLIVNSFSKTWAMTGWRLGWITIPRSLQATFEMLVEFNFSCVPEPTQRAGITAVTQGEPFVAASLSRYQQARDFLLERLAAFPRVSCHVPEATFYAWLAVEGMADSFSFAEQALLETGVGLAPGLAFGPEGEGHLRICFAAELEALDEAIERLKPMLV
ncbi:MAG: pyridoxal phosphate-dependent aminotransferase [Chloroflexota bacterium]